MSKYDAKKKLWDEPELPTLTNDEIHAIVGRVPVTVSSDGTITIDKTLSASEKTAIEALLLTRKV